MDVTIKQKLAKTTNFESGRTMTIQYIVIHYTANDGDTDEGNGIYFANNTVKASAHYFVDEDSVTNSVLESNTAWHCGDTQKYTNGGATYKGICKNANSIGIEMCSDKKNGEFVITEKTVENTIWLVKSLMKKYSIPVSRVIRHFDVTGKGCPEPFIKHPEQWISFKNKLVETESEDDEDMTRYNKVSEMPSYAQATIQDLVNRKVITGDTNGNLNLTEDMIRTLIFIERIIKEGK